MTERVVPIGENPMDLDPNHDMDVLEARIAVEQGAVFIEALAVAEHVIPGYSGVYKELREKHETRFLNAVIGLMSASQQQGIRFGMAVKVDEKP